MISDVEARRYAAKIRRGKDTLRERGDYDRWARATKGRRQRTPLAALLAERDVRARAQQAASDLLQQAPRRTESAGFDNPAPITGQTFEPASMPADYVRTAKPEPPIAPPLPPLDGEIVEPIAPPIDLGDAPEPAPSFNVGAGGVKFLRALLEKQDARNGTPEVGGFSLASMHADFWQIWEDAAKRLADKHIGVVNLSDDELVVGGSVAVVAQPIAIPYVKEHGAEWIAKIKGWFGGAS